MKEQNITFKFEADIEELSKSLEFLISQIGCSAEEAGKAMANLSKALSQINVIDNQFIAADTTEKNEPLEIFDPIELNKDELWIVPIEKDKKEELKIAVARYKTHEPWTCITDIKDFIEKEEVDLDFDQ